MVWLLQYKNLPFTGFIIKSERFVEIISKTIFLQP